MPKHRREKKIVAVIQARMGSHRLPGKAMLHIGDMPLLGWVITRIRHSRLVDKIIVAAALDDKIPQEWKDMLKIGGKMVAPIKESIWLFIKSRRSDFASEVGTPTEASGKDAFISKEYPGFVFVPFINGNNR